MISPFKLGKKGGNPLKRTQNNKPACVSSNKLLDGTDANLFIRVFKNCRPVNCKKPVFDLNTAKNRFIVILSSEPQPIDQRPIPVDVFFLDIIQQASASADQDQQAPPGVMIFFMHFQMFSQIADAMGQNRYLYLRGPGIRVMQLELLNHFFFVFC
jgi:hypothetical protein